MKWLPHTRSATSPIAGDHITDTAEAAAALLRQLLSVARMRTADDQGDHRWPWILVVLDESADVDPALASQLLELCPAAGISVVAAVDSDARVPRQAKATFRCVPASGGAVSSVWFTEPDAARRGVRTRAGERPADRQGGDVARPAARRHLRQRHDGDPPGRAAAVVVRLGTADAAVDQRHLVEADALRVAGPDRRRPRRPARARPGGARTPHAHRRHERRRQERAAPVDRVGVDPRVPADATRPSCSSTTRAARPPSCSASAPHTVGLRHQPRRQPVAAGAHLVAGRAEPPHAADGGQGQGSRRDARALPGRGPAVAGDRRRRVRHAGQGGPRLRGRRRRHRPARPQPRGPPDPRHAAAVGRRSTRTSSPTPTCASRCACSTPASRRR